MYGSAVPAPPPELPWNPSPTLLTRSRTTTSVPHPPPPSTASPTTSPTPSTTRSGRLRGLSYLRNYTHNHLLSRDSNSNNSSNQRPPTLARATSYPSSTSPTTHTAGASATSREGVTAQRLVAEGTPTRASDPDTNTASTSGWLPTAGGLSGVEITASEPQSTIEALNSAVLSSNGPSAGSSDLEASMARTRHVPATGTSDPPPDGAGAESETQTQNTTDRSDGPHGMHHQLPSVRFTAHQDPRAQRPSLVFSPISRILPSGKEVIKVGRYSERDNQPIQTINVPSATPVGFKSKVVSRRHCEFWCSEGRWYIKDVKSSSGTFLNHIRLSSPGTESRPFPVNDGDIVQLGIDFKGGEEMIFRCVKIRVELNKGWQHGPSSFKYVISSMTISTPLSFFSVQSHKRLRELNSVGKPAGTSQDCSICLGAIAVGFCTLFFEMISTD
jgi:pSer/pThr/pTyr-binding forkhead associated (FHA) protein